jgi:hypothetical protein
MHAQMVKAARSDLDAIHVHKGFMGIALQYTDRGLTSCLVMYIVHRVWFSRTFLSAFTLILVTLHIAR